MQKYSFLFKPLFFICSLVFATWLVFYIEKISPSDFGRYEILFNSTPKPLPKETKVQNLITYGEQRQAILKKICTDYKAGLIDSIQLDQRLKIFLKSTEEVSPK
jgi:hypothetical protein